MKKENILAIVIFSLGVIFFFKSFFLQGLIPIPADTIIGLYHPYRDLYAKDYPNGIPYKNSLVTDPVRQQYPWKTLVVPDEKKFSLPLWNPYSFAGYPLLANYQSSVFYPLNILFFIFSFNIAWGLLIFSQPLLGGIFLFLYLRNLKISSLASIFGSFLFSFSGFFVAWMEWGTIVSTIIWLPLILLSIDKFLVEGDRRFSFKNTKLVLWSIIFILATSSSFFAGHLQTVFYVYLISLIHFILQWSLNKRQLRNLILFILLNIVILVIISVQIIPTLQFIFLSAREVDQLNWNREGWFIPFQNAIQFLVPDYFGNPTTLNYWGIWNYGEFIGYVGIAGILFALYALLFRRDRKTLFMGALLVAGVIFAFPTFIAKIPYILNIPFISSSQPTRLLSVMDFALACLSAFGLDYFIKHRKKILFPLLTIFILFLIILVISYSNIFQINPQDLEVTKRNIIFPITIFLITSALVILYILIKNKKIAYSLIVLLIGVSVFDLFRFANKFLPFTDQNYLFPKTKTIEFLQKNIGNFRIMSTDSRILPPNFSNVYKIQSIEGYDPLYLKSYGELIIASERNKPNISPPFGFNRIITPQNINSPIINLLGVKYILSLSEIKNPNLKLVNKEGQTHIYENYAVLPRVFFVSETINAVSKQEAINRMLDKSFNPLETGIVLNGNSQKNLQKGIAKITSYSEDRVVISTQNNGDGFIVLTDSYYPTWKVSIDGKKSDIILTDYNFRGVYVPSGSHTIEFTNTLF